MRVVVDGIVYGVQSFGGINAYFNALLPRLASKPNVSVELLVPRLWKSPPPQTGISWRHRELIPTRTGVSWTFDQWVMKPFSKLMDAITLSTRVNIRKPCIFQSSYFTRLGYGVNQVATAYDMNHELFPELYADAWGRRLRKQYRTYLSNASRILAISAKTKEDIVDVYNINPSVIDVVHLAVDRDVFFPENKQDDRNQELPQGGMDILQHPYILYVGGRWHYKNFSRTLEAFSRLKQDENDVHLVVAGKSWSVNEQEMIQSLKLDDRVHLVTNPDQQELCNLYRHSLAFIFPSLHEGFGIPLLEAMSCGTAVLASDTSIFREVAGDAALFFNPLEPEDIARAIADIRNPGSREKFVSKGFLRVSDYSWDRCAEETLAVYQKTLE